MSERSQHRRPATFKLDDPGVIVMDPDDASSPPRGTVHITPETDLALLPVPIEAPALPVQRGFRWGAVFWTAICGLVLLGTGLGVTHLIEDLFARSEGLGLLGLAFAFVATLALVVVSARGLTAVTTETRCAAVETSRRASSSSGAINSRSASLIMSAPSMMSSACPTSVARARASCGF